MNNSLFDELFGEREDGSLEEETLPVKVEIGWENKNLRLLLGLFISMIVLAMTFIVTHIYYEIRPSPKAEVLGEKVIEKQEQDSLDTSLDLFMDKFVDSSYEVNDSGAFAYIYGDSKDGTISLGEGNTYFENGRIALINIDEKTRVFWTDYDEKFIFFLETKEYFPVNQNSNFYYKSYLGQHILQDIVDDYRRNRDFIIQVDEETWGWEWSFYTPKSDLQKYNMRTEIVLDISTNYISEIRVFNEGDKICTFEFSFNVIDDIDESNVFDGYEIIDEPEVTSL